MIQFKCISVAPPLTLPFNFKWITPNKLVGMCRPGIHASSHEELEAGQNTFDANLMVAQLASLYDLGIRQIVSLTSEFRDLIKTEWDSKSATAFLPIDLVDCSIPKGNESEFDRILTFIQQAPTAVHCGAGVGRTGMILAAWHLHNQTNNDHAPQSIARDPIFVWDLDHEKWVPVSNNRVAKAIHDIRTNYNPHAVEFSNQADALTRWNN